MASDDLSSGTTSMSRNDIDDDKDCSAATSQSDLEPPTMNDEAETDVENRPTAAVVAALEALLAEKYDTPSSYALSKASAKGDNYLGIVYRISVAAADGRRASLILKVPPQSSVRRKQFFAQPCFARESLAYEQFLPLTAQYQQERGVAPEERFQHYAKCYRSITAELDEAIFLEDLCATGFAVYDRFQELHPDHVRAVMRAYGKLHAVSLALKQQQPARLQVFQQMVDIFKQRENDQALGAYFEQLKTSALDTVDAPADQVYRSRLAAYFAGGTAFQLLLEQLDSQSCEPYAVVCHGDCWNNNIMYRHEADAAMEARLIDWQIMRYASPMTDLAYFFFTCTTRQFRDAHYAEMLDVYYAEAVQQLQLLGVAPQSVYPREAFDAQVQQRGAAGLLLAMMVLPIITISGSDVPDLEALSKHIEAGGTTDLKDSGFLGASNEQLYKQRMRDVIIDCVKFNYI